MSVGGQELSLTALRTLGFEPEHALDVGANKAPSFAEKIAFMDAAGFRPWDISDMNYVSAAYKGGRFKGPGRILAGFDMLLVRKGSLLANATQQRLDV